MLIVYLNSCQKQAMVAGTCFQKDNLQASNLAWQLDLKNLTQAIGLQIMLKLLDIKTILK